MRRAKPLAAVALVAALGLGGCSAIFGVDEAEYAPGDAGSARVDPDGAASLTDARTLDDPDAGGRGDGGAATYLVVLGGSSGGARRAEVYSARLAATGMPEAFRPTTPLPEALDELVAFSAGERIFVAGGLRGGGQLSARVYAASVLADGDVGPWSDVSPPLPSPRRRHAAAVVGERVFVSGGIGADGGLLRDIATAAVTQAGLGPWTTAGRLDEGVYAHDSLPLGGRLLVVGGHSTSERADVLAYAVGPNGALGAGTALTPLPTPTGYGRTVAVGGVPFVIGGVENGNLLVVPYVRFAEMNDAGALRAWMRSTDIPNSRWFHGVVASEDNLYVVAGHGPQGAQRREYDDVLVGRVRSDKSVAWTASPSFLPRVLAGHGVVLVKR